MSGLRNNVTLIGRLGKDPELKEFDGGKCKSNFSMATKEVFMKDGEKQEKTQWHNVVMWGNLAKVSSDHLKKGSHIAVRGQVTYRSYDDKDGNTKYITEIVASELEFLEGKKAG